MYFVFFLTILSILLLLLILIQKEIKIKLENDKTLAEKLGNLKLDEIPQPQPVENTIATQEYGKPTSQLATESTSVVLSIRRSARLAQQQNQ